MRIVRNFTLFAAIILMASCVENRPSDNFFDVLEVKARSKNEGVISYRVNKRWINWSSTEDVDINKVGATIMFGYCTGQASIDFEGIMEYKILPNANEETIYIGNNSQIKCVVKNSPIGIKIFFIPVIKNLSFGDSGDGINTKHIIL